MFKIFECNEQNYEHLSKKLAVFTIDDNQVALSMHQLKCLIDYNNLF